MECYSTEWRFSRVTDLLFVILGADDSFAVDERCQSFPAAGIHTYCNGLVAQFGYCGADALSGECADDRRGRGRRKTDVSTTEVKSVYAGSGGYGTLKYLVEARSAARNDGGARRSADRTEFATGDASRIQFAPQDASRTQLAVKDASTTEFAPCDASGERACARGRTKTAGRHLDDSERAVTRRDRERERDECELTTGDELLRTA
ncbi:hypothetical protein ON010_g1470 [Phytophthora cinnamomi]|nr:hypothetical protein ON010_g1470 [Phytophthora cinnamomi]